MPNPNSNIPTPNPTPPLRRQQRHLRSVLQQLNEWFDPPKLLLTLTKQSGFIRRKARKLSPLLFVQATVLLISQSAVSFRHWAALVGVLGDLCLSKQALWKRSASGPSPSSNACWLWCLPDVCNFLPPHVRRP